MAAASGCAADGVVKRVASMSSAPTVAAAAMKAQPCRYASMACRRAGVATRATKAAIPSAAPTCRNMAEIPIAVAIRADPTAATISPTSATVWPCVLPIDCVRAVASEQLRPSSCVRAVGFVMQRMPD